MSEEEKKEIKNEETVKNSEEKKAEEALKDSIKFDDFISKDESTTEEKSVEDKPKGEISPQTVSLEEYQRLEKEFKDMRETLLRVAADYDNYRKRVVKEIEEKIKSAKQEILHKFLETADNLELTLINSQRVTPKNEEIIKGFEITYKGFLETLKSFGVTQFNPENTVFDPNFHDAIGMVESETVPSGHIIRVERKGYMYNDRLLRAALVVVSKGMPAKPEAKEQASEEPERVCIAEPDIEEEKKK